MLAEEELYRRLCLPLLPCPLAMALSHLAPPKQQVSASVMPPACPHAAPASHFVNTAAHACAHVPPGIPDSRQLSIRT